jgi:hypothetical protein
MSNELMRDEEESEKGDGRRNEIGVMSTMLGSPIAKRSFTSAIPENKTLSELLS